MRHQNIVWFSFPISGIYCGQMGTSLAHFISFGVCLGLLLFVYAETVRAEKR